MIHDEVELWKPCQEDVTLAEEDVTLALLRA